MEKLSKPEAIIFDFDDTLVNSKPIISKALEATLNDFNLKLDILKGIDTTRSFRDYFCEVFKEDMEKARQIYYSYYDMLSVELDIIPGTIDVLDLLKNNNVYTVIVSNKNHERLGNEVRRKLNWGKYFREIVGSGAVDEDKPSAKPAIFALKALELRDYKNVWFIGDSLVDMQAAQNLNCKGFYFGASSEYKNLIMHRAIKDHYELLKLLKKIYV